MAGICCSGAAAGHHHLRQRQLRHLVCSQQALPRLAQSGVLLSSLQHALLLGLCPLQIAAILAHCPAAMLSQASCFQGHAPIPAGTSGSNHHLPARRVSALGDPTRRSSTSPSTTQRIRSINREAQINDIISERLDHWKQASGNRLVGRHPLERKRGRSQNGCACWCSNSERGA